jgi:hypothetical protein
MDRTPRNWQRPLALAAVLAAAVAVVAALASPFDTLCAKVAAVFVWAVVV